MSDSTTIQESKIKANTQSTNISKYNDKRKTSLRPLPNGRPIASNVTDDIDQLMGYLD